MLTVFLALTGFACLVALLNWRMGIFAMILVGIFQDPLRKLTAGVPSYFVLGAAIVFIAVVLSAYMRGHMHNLRPLWLEDKNLKGAWSLFALVILLQALHAFIRWHNPLLPTLGLLVYFGPVVAIFLCMTYAESERAIRRFMQGYVLLVAPAALTVYLSVSHSDSWPVLRDIGTFLGQELVIYDVGTALSSHPGIFRAGEIAAWHAATSASFLVILATQNRSLAIRLFVGAVIVLLIGAIVLTGRRKMLMTLTIFLVSQWTLLGIFRGRIAPLTAIVMVLGIFGSFAFTLLDPASEQALYVERGKTVFADAFERIGVAFDLFQSAVYRSGGLGLGAGVTAQGAQHVGGSIEVAGGAAEAGLGKVVVELGIPGALVVIWLLVALALRLLKGLEFLSGTSDRMLFYSVSFLSLLIANGATFAVATQVYGDLFILIILGFILGMVFAIDRAGHRLYLIRNIQSRLPQPGSDRELSRT